MAWLNGMNFKVLKTFLTITLWVKITFVGSSHVAPAWGQNRFIYQAANDWSIYLMKLKKSLTFYILKDILGVFYNL